MNGMLTLIWSLGILLGLLCLYQLSRRLLHFCVTRFGIETTALVISARRYDKDGDLYLQGHYVYHDTAGCEHLFDFTICSYWPGDEQWHKVMHLYRQGAQNRVRYLRWLPILHNIQAPICDRSANLGNA